MTSEELHARWKARPFQPFRVVMKDGTTYDVTHPRYAFVGGAFFHFFYQQSPDEPFDDYDRRVPADIDHIEDLPRTVIPHSRSFPADAPGMV
jgi:hypothetical protein